MALELPSVLLAEVFLLRSPTWARYSALSLPSTTRCLLGEWLRSLVRGMIPPSCATSSYFELLESPSPRWCRSGWRRRKERFERETGSAARDFNLERCAPFGGETGSATATATIDCSKRKGFVLLFSSIWKKSDIRFLSTQKLEDLVLLVVVNCLTDTLSMFSCSLVISHIFILQSSILCADAAVAGSSCCCLGAAEAGFKGLLLQNVAAVGCAVAGRVQLPCGCVLLLIWKAKTMLDLAALVSANCMLLSEQQEVEEAEDKETLVDTQQETEPEPKEKEVPPLISTDQTEDLLGLNEINPKAAELEESNALALPIVPHVEEAEDKETLVDTQQETEPEPKEKEVPPLISTDQTEDLLGLNEINPKAAELEESNALALPIVPHVCVDSVLLDLYPIL
ncbi:hypothetical protein TEA_022248 [Camellia sinensis var. sinensis]|uniref:Uncharacterized protein n=1 Tax=Camellia sinensis var. sinensis TaxID=542762 RepID=A0A4S4E190_CAMSN|nr:hypothetical protein TEA_022248 [Camellia sinensis var. sinensis]